jgi:type VI secretion system secreted protein VgrG
MDAGEFEAGGKAGTGQHFSCSFTAIDAAQPFRPPRITPKPMIHGVQTAMVVGPSGETIHTDKYGRIKVHFHWDRDDQGDDNSSCWIRVSQPWGGKNWGGMFVPHVGQEVVVSFEEGDPDCPLITGRMYNPDQMPPLGLPDNKTKSVIRDHGGNEIIMEGKDGEQHVQIKQTCGNEIMMNGKGGEESIKITDHAGNFLHMNAVSGSEFIQIQDKYGNMIKLDAVAKFMRLSSPTHNSFIEIGKSIVDSTDSDNKRAISGDYKITVLGESFEFWGGFKQEIFIGHKHSSMVGIETKLNAAYVIERGKSKLNTIVEEDIKIDSQKSTTVIGGHGAADFCKLVLSEDAAELMHGDSKVTIKLDGDITVESKTNVKIEAKGANITLKATDVIIDGKCNVTGHFTAPNFDGGA